MRHEERILLDWGQTDVKNHEQLRVFFEKYRPLTTNDLAQILSLSAKTIRGLKKLVKMGGKKKSPPPQVAGKPLPKLPENWDTEEWWRANYPKYGIIKLSQMTGLTNPNSIYYRLKRHGLQPRDYRESVKSKHKCCNRSWLMEHYVRGNKTLSDCARLAGVCNDAIVGWLNRFKIQVRPAGGTTVAKDCGERSASPGGGDFGSSVSEPS